MEGFTSEGQTGAGRRFVYLNNYKFAMQAREEDIEKYPDRVATRTKTRGVNAGESITEMSTSAIIGHISEIIRREVPYQCDTGHEFNISIRDTEGQTFQIALKDQARQATYILTRLPNVDLSKPIKLGVFKSELLKDNKPYPDPVFTAQLFIQQKDESGKWVTVQNAYPKDSGLGMPEFVKGPMFKGKQQWDNTDQWNWLLENVALPTQVMITELSQSTPPTGTESKSDVTVSPAVEGGLKAPKAKVVTPQEATPIGGELEDDDLPF